MRRSASSIVALLLGGTLAASQAPRPEPVAQDAMRAIIDAFASHDLVALSDAHGDPHAQAFQRALIEAPGFADVVNDVVVEFGNARYQALVDRYVGGEALTIADLQPLWQNVVTPNQIWADEEFFAAVRRVNVGRPADRRLRILLADPPIDWATVQTREQFRPWLAMRDSFPAALLQVEVLARRRKALILYGQLHFQRRQIMSNYEMADWRMQTIVSLVERATPARVFTIWRLGDELRRLLPASASFTRPMVWPLRGTTLGAEDAARLSPAWTRARRFTVVGDVMTPVPEADWRSLPVEEQLDAVLDLGRSADAATERPVPALACAGPGFLDERLRRIAVAGIPPAEADRVRAICAGQQP